MDLHVLSWSLSVLGLYKHAAMFPGLHARESCSCVQPRFKLPWVALRTDTTLRPETMTNHHSLLTR